MESESLIVASEMERSEIAVQKDSDGDVGT